MCKKEIHNYLNFKERNYFRGFVWVLQQKAKTQKSRKFYNTHDTETWEAAKTVNSSNIKFKRFTIIANHVAAICLLKTSDAWRFIKWSSILLTSEHSKLLRFWSKNESLELLAMFDCRKNSAWFYPRVWCTIDGSWQ